MMKPANICLIIALALLAGCAGPPIGADRVSARASYAQVEKNVLSSGQPSSYTAAVLHRYDLGGLAVVQPEKAVSELYYRTLATGDRELLFALAEMSYLAADEIHRSLKPWDQRDARDYYLGAAVYAYLYLFGDSKGARPSPFDGRFRTACDLYNYGLGWALTERDSTNVVVQLESSKRKLPVGEIELSFSRPTFPWSMDSFERFLLADQFRVRGLSVRNREHGVGAPLIAELKYDPHLRLRRCGPATIFLRLNGSLAELGAGTAKGDLELYSVFAGQSTVDIGGTTVPLETDLTAHRAFVLNQSFAWKAQSLQFFSPSTALRTQIIRGEPYQPGRIPIVFIHGTFSSPVWWAEMVNTLIADPVLRRRYQIWMGLYASSKPIVLSAAEVREQITATVQELDPEGKDPALRQMVVIGHSQGGLITKLTATDTGDKLWRVFSDKPLDEVKMSEEKRAQIRRLAFFEPLPYVRRVVFISTPHRGSYLSVNFVRRWAKRLISMPANLTHKSTDLLTGTEGIKIPAELKGARTSLDGMSPRNPVALKLAEVPVAPNIKAHSIIPVKGGGDFRKGRDGVVAYKSAHVDYVESELVVRSGHSCQDKPAAIEEVRRILHEHLASVPASQTASKEEK
jgi:pimeloyl-ACP methyl ester carboxylesterase